MEGWIRVLYVDDEPALLNITQIYLQKLGEFNVSISESAGQALEMLSHGSFDVIVSDYQMPEMDGIGFLKAVRERFGDIPFILFTGRGREEVVIAAINNGADFYLQKGGDPKAQFTELAHKVRQAVRRKQAENLVKESGEKFRTIFENSPYPIAINSLPDGKFISVNRAFLQSSGYQEREVLGKSPIEIGLLSLIDFGKLASQFLMSGRIDNMPVALTGKGGGRIHASFSTIPVTINNKPAILTMAAEVTKLKRIEEELLKKTDDLNSAYTNLAAAEEELREKYDQLKAQEEALRESEEKYRILVEHNRDGVFILQDGRLVFYNQALAGLSGYSAEELNGILLADILAPEDRDMVVSRAKDRAMGKEVPERYEFSLLHKDGIRRIRMQVRTYLGLYKGRPASFGTFFDVTEERRQGAALRESEAKFRTIFENIQDVFYRTDMEGNILLISPSGADLLGYRSVDELVGFPIAAKMYENPADRAAFLAKLKENGFLRDYELNLRHVNGSVVRVSTNSHYYYNPEGQIAGIEGILRDITGKKKAEEDLKRSENLYRTVFENTGTGTILIAPDTTILRANAGFERLTGVSRKEMENQQSWTTFIHPDDVDRMKQYHTERRRDPVAVPNVYECRLVDSGGAIHFCFVHVDVIPDTGNSVASVVDVTPLKTAEDALRQSEEKIRVILDNLPDLVVVHRDGVILYVNPAMTESMGRLPDEVVGHSILEFIAPEYHAKVAESIRLRLDHGLNESYEIELQPREGKRRIVNIRGTVISFEGSPAIMNVLTDITAVKQTEKALLESEEKYRSLVENSNDIIYSMDTTGVIRNISPQISRYGFSEDEVLSRSLTSFIEEEDLPGVLRDFETTLTTGRSTITIFRIRDKSGMIRWMEDNGTAIFDLSGGVVGLSGILRDITDRKHAEDSLHESEERFRSLVETSPDIVWEIDPRGLFVYISPMVSRILGYMPEEILGRSITELVPERAKPFVMQGLAEHIMSDSPLPPLQVPARHRDGHELTLEIRSSKVMDAEGNLTGLRGLAVDITDRKKTEDAIRLANHQINLITSITRHDIKNKIAVILGYLGIAKEASTDPTHGDYIAKIESATLAIQSLIEEAKVYQELGSQEPRWQDLESTLPLAYVPGSVTLNSSVGGIEVYADLMLGKVFFNLLDNSLQHGEHATEITVSSRRTGEALLLLWEDNGVGIPEGEKEKIFERGYGKHTGLGMFLVREILALTGITIRETGILGRGARFEIKVPEEQFRISP